MEAEIRAILTAAVTEPSASPSLAVALLDAFSGVTATSGSGGLDLELPARTAMPRTVDLPS